MTVVFDREAVINRCDGDISLVKELMQMFVDDYSRALSEIELSVKGGDGYKVNRSAHAIKSALGNLGGMEAYEAAYKLEIAGKEGKKENYEKLFQDLSEKVDCFIAEWNEQKNSF